MSTAFVHEPVMVEEVIGLFDSVPAGIVLDATIGGGGHSAALLERRPDLNILGIDRDSDAIDASLQRLSSFADRVKTSHRRFDELGDVLNEHRLEEISGAVFDLGVSSPQLDRAERGFSYRHDGPLDMRMDTDQQRSATDVVNGLGLDALARIIHQHGGERFAQRIAEAIVRARPIETTTQFAEIISSAIPAAARRTGRHPARRTFQAIRIEVNRELELLPQAISAAIDRTHPGGRVVVLSYHSGEDRIVRSQFAVAAGACDCPPGLPCVCGAVKTVRIVRRVAKRASPAEQERNRRAKSARLRAVEKIEPHRKSDGDSVGDLNAAAERH